MSEMGGKRSLDTPLCASMSRAMITLALCVFPPLVGCGKPEPSGVRLVKAHGPSDCHLTLNGVRIPDYVLEAKGSARRGKKPAVNDESDRCEGATIMLRQAGMNTDEMPSINLSN